MAADLVIRGAVVLRPPFDRRAAFRADVVVSGGLVADIVAAAERDWGDAGHVIDAAGLWLIPGLIDAHAHIAAADAPDLVLDRYLDAGVTSIRDAGARDDSSLELARSHAAVPPRIFTAGRMLRAGPGPGPGVDVRAAAEATAGAGAAWLKAYELSPAEVRAVTDVAAAHGLPAAAHLGSAARESVRGGGIRAVEHVFSLLEYDLVAEETRRRTAIPAADATLETYLLVDPHDGPLAEWIAELAALSVTVTPTLTVMAPLVGRAPEAMDVIHPAEAPWSSARERHLWLSRLQEFGWWSAPDAESALRREQVLLRFDEVVRALHAAGCFIAAGTDFGEPFIEAGRGLHAEMRALHRAGLPLHAVLAAATAVPAGLLGRPGVLGNVVVGAAADLALLAANPLESLDALDTIRAVIAGGRLREPTATRAAC
jgi:imidazolonepropionase-like amidohydrolase